ncbi:MAG: hypothetical protein PS018_29330 [bacterium]|nr:hypothetical protein [bacterium]
MDNRINAIRKEIRILRSRMLETEAAMRDRVNRDEGCAELAGEILLMRGQMSKLARERISLGDRELILVGCEPRRVSTRGIVIPRLPGKASFTRSGPLRTVVPPSPNRDRSARAR